MLILLLWLKVLGASDFVQRTIEQWNVHQAIVFSAAANAFTIYTVEECLEKVDALRSSHSISFLIKI